MCIYVYVTDQLQTWTVLKWSSRYKMGQTISKPQTVLKQARPFKKTGQTTGQTILVQAGQTIQTISKGVNPFLKESDQ